LALTPSARAGLIDEGHTEAPLVFDCSGSCDKYQIIASSPDQPIYFHPLTKYSFKPGEWAQATIEPPEWEYPNNQGLMLRVEFGGSVLGANWKADVCAPGCGHLYKSGDNSVMDLPLGTADTGARILLRQTGSTTQTGSAVTPIHLRASTHWYIVDNVSPSLGFSINGKGLENRIYNAADGEDDLLSVTLSASDNTSILPDSLKVNGAPMAFSPDDGSVTVNVGNGSHPLPVRIYDIAGNYTDAAPVITYDSAAPSVTLLNAMQPGAPFPVFTTKTPVFVVRAIDPLVGGEATGIKSGKLRVDDQIIDATTSLSNDSMTLQPNTPIEEGIHSGGAQVFDAAGNLGEDPNESQFAIDLNPPTVDSVTPEAGKQYPGNGAPTTLTANATDQVGIQKVSMLFDGSKTVELDPPDQIEPPKTWSSVGTVDGLQCPGWHRAAYTVTDWAPHSVTKEWSWKVGGKLKGTCKTIACNRAKAWVKNLTRSASPLQKELRKQKNLLEKAQHQSHSGPKAKQQKAAAKQQKAAAKVPGLKILVANLKAQVKKNTKDLRTAHKLRSDVC
jgi:hypothetical protein